MLDPVEDALPPVSGGYSYSAVASLSSCAGILAVGSLDADLAGSRGCLPERGVPARNFIVACLHSPSTNVCFGKFLASAFSPIMQASQPQIVGWL